MSDEVVASQLPPFEPDNRVNGCASDESGNLSDDPSTGSKRNHRKFGELTPPEDVEVAPGLSANLRHNEPIGLMPPTPPSTDRSRRRSVDGASPRVCYSLGHLKILLLILELSRYLDPDSVPVIDLELSLCPS
jgi:hypothetical protein